MEINNFRVFKDDAKEIKGVGFASDHATDGDTKKFWDGQVKDEFESNGHFFKAGKDKKATFLKKDGSETKGRCIATMNIPKFNDGS